MEVVEDINDFKNDGLALTIGFFDGVHAGHRFLIDQLKTIADEEHLKTAIFTFWPHPRIVLNERYQPRLLNSLDEKIELLSQQPIDYCIKIPFNMELANMQARDFMQMLKEKLNVKHLLVGYDHRFGRNREEGFDDYCQYGKELGMEVSQSDPYTEGNYSISSTFIRQLLAVGEVVMANHYLGYTYELTGKVIHGNMAGRTIGYPTANVQLNCKNKCLPKIGVYAAMVEVDKTKYKAMMYIGTRPTINSSELTIEAHLFNFSGDLYDKTITIYPIDHVRNQHKFESMEALKAQIDKDKRMVNSILRLY